MIESYNRDDRARFKFIPEFENWPRFVAFSSRWYGKLILSSAFLLILSTFQMNWNWERFAIVVVAGLLPLKPVFRFLLIMVGVNISNRGFFLYVDDEKKRDSIFQMAHSIGAIAKEVSWGFSLIQLSILVLTILGLSWILSRRLIRFPLLLLFSIWIALIAFALPHPVQSAEGYAIWIFVRNFSYCLLAVYMCSQSPAYVKSLRLFDRIALSAQNLVIPFALPFLKVSNFSTQSFSQQSVPRVQHETVQQIKGLKLLLASRVVYLGYQLIQETLFGGSHSEHRLGIPSLNLENFRYIGLENFNQGHHSMYFTWMIVIANCAVYILMSAATTGKTVSLLRLSGFNLPRPTYRLTDSRSFNDYFKRFLFYYCRTLVSCFFYGIWDALEALKWNEKLRTGLSLFFTVTVGGLMIHAIMSANSIVYFGLRETLQFLKSEVLYFVLLGIVCTLSWSRNSSQKLGVSKSLLPQPAVFLLLFLIHACLLTLSTENFPETFDSKLSLWSTLLGVR